MVEISCRLSDIPSSFFDSNGDGIGDLNGIHSNLKDLGIDVLWLSPIYRSPQADMEYDMYVKTPHSDLDAVLLPHMQFGLS